MCHNSQILKENSDLIWEKSSKWNAMKILRLTNYHTFLFLNCENQLKAMYESCEIFLIFLNIFVHKFLLVQSF